MRVRFFVNSRTKVWHRWLSLSRLGLVHAPDRRLEVLLLVLMVGFYGPLRDAWSQERTPRQLVQQLGAERFAERQAAQLHLRQLGLEAFDELFAARSDRDIERRLAARELLREIKVDFAGESAPADVRELVRDYGQRPAAERELRIRRLSQLDVEHAATPLTRIVRYELTETLSKRAALELMQLLQRPPGSVRKRLGKRLREELGKASRPAADWVRLTLLGSAEEAAHADRWERIVQQELGGGWRRASTKDDARIARDLIRWQVQTLLRMDQSEAAEEAAQRLVPLVGNERAELLESLDWLLRKGLHKTVKDLAESHQRLLAEQPLLLYHVAEAQLRGKQIEAAQQTAKRACELSGDDGRAHVEVALQLQERGLETWARQEYLAAIRCAKLGSVPDVDARWLLAEALAREQRWEEATAKLETLVEAIRRDAEVEKQVWRRREPASLVGRLEYYRACHARQQQEPAASWEHLLKANAAQPNDTRILIAMHQLAAAQRGWQAEAEHRCELALSLFLDRIRELEARLGEFQESGPRQLAVRTLADYRNRQAWLLVQTQGDLQIALTSARRAIELAPDVAGYRDTLAHVLAARGDWQAAIDQQTRAVELQPHHTQLQRYLGWLQKQAAVADR